MHNGRGSAAQGALVCHGGRGGMAGGGVQHGGGGLARIFFFRRQENCGKRARRVHQRGGQVAFANFCILRHGAPYANGGVNYVLIKLFQAGAGCYAAAL